MRRNWHRRRASWSAIRTCWPKRRWTWSATSRRWAKNAIPRQTLEDQEKLVLQDQGTVKNDEGTVQYDQVQVSYCHITSPISGRVGLRLVDPGNLVTANSTTTLVVVTQIQPITVIFTLAEDNLPRFCNRCAVASTLEVEAYDRTQQKLSGHRQADHHRQPDRHHHGHRETARRSSTTATACSFPTSL